MAHKIKMWHENGPQLAPATPMSEDEFIEELVRGVNQTRGTALSMMSELQGVVVKNLKGGRIVKLLNGWSFRPVGKSDGTIEIHVRLPKEMVEAVNSGFRGKWINAQNIGLGETAMIEIWNAQHPDDLIQINGHSGPPTPDQPPNGNTPDPL